MQLKFYPIIGFAAASLTLVHAQNVDVTAHLTIQANPGHGTMHHKDGPVSAGIVVWLVPLKSDSRPASTGHPGPFRLLQKDKMFTPHLLVVPTGSSVEFPNQDPFFHNVFSLFNGKRFDLGLYDSGTSKTVHFDREGVSYIFCNIHPEMGAVVLALSTPYYAVSSVDGMVDIRDVPPGYYRVHIWSELAKSVDPVDAQKVIQVGRSALQLGEITLEPVVGAMQNHKNKFGDDYHPNHTAQY